MLMLMFVFVDVVVFMSVRRLVVRVLVCMSVSRVRAHARGYDRAYLPLGFLPLQKLQTKPAHSRNRKPSDMTRPGAR